MYIDNVLAKVIKDVTLVPNGFDIAGDCRNIYFVIIPTEFNSLCMFVYTMYMGILLNDWYTF